MQALVINLDHQTERLAFQVRQLAGLGLTMHRIAAVKTSDPRVLDRADYWDTWQRPLSLAERACLLSHKTAWETVLDSGVPMLILEDDAVLSRDTSALLDTLQTLDGLEHVTLEFRGRKKWLDRRPQPLGLNRFLTRLYLDRTGAAAYVLWPSGARKLLSLARSHCGLADGLICECKNLLSFQVEPAPAFQLDQCEKLGFAPPILTRSSITPTQQNRSTRRWVHRWRRIQAQLRMAWRQIYSWPQARRRHVSVASETFDLQRT